MTSIRPATGPSGSPAATYLRALIAAALFQKMSDLIVKVVGEIAKQDSASPCSVGFQPTSVTEPGKRILGWPPAIRLPLKRSDKSVRPAHQRSPGGTSARSAFVASAGNTPPIIL
jgi:hypothetical protein